MAGVKEEDDIFFGRYEKEGEEDDDKRKKGYIGPKLKFCPISQDLMYPKEDRSTKKLIYYCRTTGYDEEADDYCISRQVINRSDKNQEGELLGDMMNDPTLARSRDVECPKCHAREAVFKQAITPQGMDLYFQCVHCRNDWAETNQ